MLSIRKARFLWRNLLGQITLSVNFFEDFRRSFHILMNSKCKLELAGKVGFGLTIPQLPDLNSPNIDWTVYSTCISLWWMLVCHNEVSQWRNYVLYNHLCGLHVQLLRCLALARYSYNFIGSISYGWMVCVSFSSGDISHARITAPDVSRQIAPYVCASLSLPAILNFCCVC